MRRGSVRTVSVLAAAATALAAAPAISAAGPSAVTLGEGVAPLATNDRGVVVGSYYTGTATVGFRWTAASGLEELPLLDGDTSGAATDVNAAGDILAYSQGSDGSARHWYVVTRTTVTPLPLFDGAEVGGISNRGEVAGALVGESTLIVEVVATGSTTTAALPGSIVRVGGVNDAGQVAGGYVPAGATREQPFLWTPGPDGGTTTALTLPPGDERGGAMAVNDRGQVAGYHGSPGTSPRSADWRAFVWTPRGDGGAMEDLGLRSYTGLVNAAAINARGDVVGWVPNMGIVSVPFRWTEPPRGSDLRTVLLGMGFLGAGLRATDINDRGDIVGYGLLRGGTRATGFVLPSVATR